MECLDDPVYYLCYIVFLGLLVILKSCEGEEGTCVVTC